MPLNSDLVGLLVSPVDDGFEKGTVYPIRDGVVITAAHVIPDIEKYNQLENKNSYILWPTIDEVAEVQQIIFCCVKSDVAVLKCETPSSLSPVVICKDIPDSEQHWDSEGYARSAIEPDLDKHDLESAKGSYIKRLDNKAFQQLETQSYMTDESFWSGMSGAPIFKANTSFLTGIFIESSPRYDDVNGESEALFKGRLRAASIAHLLDSADFAEAVYGKDYSEYQQTNEKKLREIWASTPAFKEKLPDCDEVLAQLRSNPIKCIQNLKKDCKDPKLSQCKNEMQSLFYLLLSQVDVPCRWQGKHYHELEVSTRLLAELSVAKLYGVEPKFDPSEHLVGQHVLPASSKELGFGAEDPAEDQANCVAYAIYKNWGNEGLSQESLKVSPQRYEEVNEQLLLSREDDGAIYRFELNEKSEEAEDHALMDEKVREYIHNKLLPDLPIVLYDRSPESAFPDEGRLQTHVRSFVKQIILA